MKKRTLKTAEGADIARPEYETLDEFVSRWIRLFWDRNVTSTSRQWCPLWARHPEAVQLFETIWRSYEQVMRKGDFYQVLQWEGMVWSRLEHLTSPGGTFRHCNSGHVDYDGYIDDEFPVEPGGPWLDINEEDDLLRVAARERHAKEETQRLQKKSRQEKELRQRKQLEEQQARAAAKQALVENKK